MKFQCVLICFWYLLISIVPEISSKDLMSNEVSPGIIAASVYNFRDPPKDCQPYNNLVGDNIPWELNVYQRMWRNKDTGIRHDLVFLVKASLVGDRYALVTTDSVNDFKDLPIYVSPTWNKSPEAAVQVKDYIEVNDDLTLLELEKPVCASKVCLPNIEKTYEWDKCLVVGTNEGVYAPFLAPDMDKSGDLSDEEIESRLKLIQNSGGEEQSCYVDYNRSLLGDLSSYSYEDELLEFKPQNDLGTCRISPGSPVMCATQDRPNEYLQMGIVYDTNYQLLNQGPNQVSNNVVMHYCVAGNFEAVGIRTNSENPIKKCNGFSVLQINSNAIKKRIQCSPADDLACPDGAVNVQLNEFPWMLGIFNSSITGSRGKSFLCAATLINSKMALTSKLCMDRHTREPFKNQLFVLSGVRNLDQIYEYQDIKEENRRRILDGREDIPRSEITLIYWNKPLVFDPVPLLNLTNNVKGCYSLGWGNYETDLKKRLDQATLQKSRVTILDSYECYLSYKASFSGYSKKALSKYTCAGSQYASSICLGDEGGPLICKIKDNPDALVGIMIESNGCPYGRTADFLHYGKIPPNLFLGFDKYWSAIMDTIKSVKKLISTRE